MYSEFSYPSAFLRLCSYRDMIPKTKVHFGLGLRYPAIKCKGCREDSPPIHTNPRMLNLGIHNAVGSVGRFSNCSDSFSLPF